MYMHYCRYHSLNNTFLFLASCPWAISRKFKHLTADSQWKVTGEAFPGTENSLFSPFSLFVVNKCKWTKLSPCHPHPLSLPTPVFFRSVCLWNTPMLSHTKEGNVSLWKQGGEISKSYLLRRELRQQKGVHGVSVSKAAIATASTLLFCSHPVLHTSSCLYLTECVCRH